MDPRARAWLERLPDLPRWVAVRDALLRPGGWLREDEDGAAALVGHPDGPAVALGFPGRAAPCAVLAAGGELLALPENVRHLRRVLAEVPHRCEPARLFEAPAVLPRGPAHPCRPLRAADLDPGGSLSGELHEELAAALERGARPFVSLDGETPVACAYAAARSEGWWDVSVDTLPSHRRLGHGSAAVLALAREEQGYGRKAVWGALRSNGASRAMAHSLGFRLVDRLWVLTGSADGE